MFPKAARPSMENPEGQARYTYPSWIDGERGDPLQTANRMNSRGAGGLAPKQGGTQGRARPSTKTMPSSYQVPVGPGKLTGSDIAAKYATPPSQYSLSEPKGVRGRAPPLAAPEPLSSVPLTPLQNQTPSRLGLQMGRDEPQMPEGGGYRVSGTQPMDTRMSETRPMDLDASARKKVRGPMIVGESLGEFSAVDVLMWKNKSQTALLFGGGCFLLLSVSLMSRYSFSLVSLGAYLMLFHLAWAFFCKNVFACGPIAFIDPETAEKQILLWVTGAAPVVQGLKNKYLEAFSGDANMTLVVAVALWVVAQLAPVMTLSALVWMAFIGAFTVPKLYSLFADRVRIQVEEAMKQAMELCAACPNKRLLAIPVFALAWHLSTLQSRLFGAFIICVAFFSYRQHYAKQVNAGVEYVQRTARRLSLNAAHCWSPQRKR